MIAFIGASVSLLLAGSVRWCVVLVELPSRAERHRGTWHGAYPRCHRDFVSLARSYLSAGAYTSSRIPDGKAVLFTKRRLTGWSSSGNSGAPLPVAAGSTHSRYSSTTPSLI